MKGTKFISIALMFSLTILQTAVAETVSLDSNGLTLRADWETVDELMDEAVLLLHGTMAHKDMEIIQTLQDGLFENGVNTLAISLSLGLEQRTGMLPCEGTHIHQHANAGKELALWVEWLQRKGIEKIWLLGHSRGGNQVTSFVLTHPAKISGLILVAPPSVDSADLAKNYQQHYGKSLDSLLVLAQMQSANGSGQALESTGFLHCDSSSVSPQSFLSYYRDANLNTAQLLERINLPVLVVSGTEDAISPDIGRAAAQLNQSNIRLLVVDGADHFFRDLYADDIVDAIVERMEPAE